MFITMVSFRNHSRLCKTLLACALATLALPAAAKDYFVATQKDYKKAATKLVPGDTIILRDGVWRDFRLVFEGEGRADAKLSLRAETPGGVILSGQSNLRMGGAYLSVSGLVFKDGFSPSRDVIDMRSPKYRATLLSELSDITIDGYSKPGTSEKDYWVEFRGIGNRLTRSAFLNKTSLGATIIVTQPLDNEIPGQHVIKDNYFGPRNPLGKNGGETLRIGVGKVAHQRFEMKVIGNYFERCNGEAEIISIKSGGNIILENMFVEASGAVTFRQGDDNLVARNIFLGNGAKGTGGVRITSFNQVVRDNYFEGLTGHDGRSAITFMDGLSDKMPVLYRQTKNASVVNNSFINVSTLTFGIKSNRDGDLPPLTSTLSKNLFLTTNETDITVAINTKIDGISVVDNTGNVSGLENIGIKADSKLQIGRMLENGLIYKVQNGKIVEIGAPWDLTPFKRETVGPSYFWSATP